MNTLCIKLLWWIPIEIGGWNIYWTIINQKIYWFDWLNWLLILIIILYIRRYLLKCKLWNYDN